MPHLLLQVWAAKGATLDINPDVWRVIFFSMGFGPDLSAAAMACQKWNKLIAGPKGTFSALYQKCCLGPSNQLPTWASVFKGFKRKGRPFLGGYENFERCYHEMMSTSEPKHAAPPLKQLDLNPWDFEHAIKYKFEYLTKYIWSRVSLEKNSQVDLFIVAIEQHSDHFVSEALNFDSTVWSQRDRDIIAVRVLEHNPFSWFENKILLEVVLKFSDPERGPPLGFFVTNTPNLDALKAASNAGYNLKNNFIADRQTPPEILMWAAEKHSIPSLSGISGTTSIPVIEKLIEYGVDKNILAEQLLNDLGKKRDEFKAISWAFEQGILDIPTHGTRYLTAITNDWLRVPHIFFKPHESWSSGGGEGLQTLIKFLLTNGAEPPTRDFVLWKEAIYDFNGIVLIDEKKFTFFHYICSNHPIETILWGYRARDFMTLWQQNPEINLNPAVPEGSLTPTAVVVSRATDQQAMAIVASMILSGADHVAAIESLDKYYGWPKNAALKDIYCEALQHAKNYLNT